MRRAWVSWVLLGLVILFVLFVRVRLLDFPFERDEGEYAYMGRLILEGVPPYLGAYNMKFPGTYAMYAFIMALTGQSVGGIHLGLALVNCASIVLMYLLAVKLLSRSAAVTAAAAYALLSLSPTVLGFAAHATHFVVLPALAGLLVLLNALRSGRARAFLLSGALFGLAVVMKQPGVFFLLFGFAYILYDRFSSSPSLWGANSPRKLFINLTIFLIGGALPLLITFTYLYAVGAFDRFWFWTIRYASRYGAQVPLSAAFGVFSENMAKVAEGHFLFWAMAAGGFIFMFFFKGMKGKRVFVALFAFFSFLTVCPGFYFRPHYFITLLPAVSLLIGIFVDWIDDKAPGLFKASHAKFAGIAVFLFAAGAAVAAERSFLFEENPLKLSRAVYGLNPFPESLEVAKFIEARSAGTDSIAVFGSEPQIYFYSGRRAATGYIYTYGLMEIHPFALGMQKEMIAEIESAKPKFVVSVFVSTSWLMRPQSEGYIFGWFNAYMRDNYNLVGVADILSDDTTVYRWNDDARNYAPQSKFHLLVFERS